VSRAKGNIAEEKGVEYLLQNGFRVVERNFYSRFGEIDIIAIKDDFSHLFKIKQAFENNEIVAMHGDRFLPGTNTVKADFFGKQTELPLGPFLLAVKYNKPVSFVNAFKESSTHYHFFATKAVSITKATTINNRNKAATQLLKEYLITLEKSLNKYPEQWFNYYYFWGK